MKHHYVDCSLERVHRQHCSRKQIQYRVMNIIPPADLCTLSPLIIIQNLSFVLLQATPNTITTRIHLSLVSSPILHKVSTSIKYPYLHSKLHTVAAVVPEPVQFAAAFLLSGLQDDSLLVQLERFGRCHGSWQLAMLWSQNKCTYSDLIQILDELAQWEVGFGDFGKKRR